MSKTADKSKELDEHALQLNMVPFKTREYLQDIMWRRAQALSKDGMTDWMAPSRHERDPLIASFVTVQKRVKSKYQPEPAVSPPAEPQSKKAKVGGNDEKRTGVGSLGIPAKKQHLILRACI